MVPPVNADTFLGTEGGIGLYTGTLHIRVRHKAAIKQASFVVVLGRHEGVALGEQAMQGEMGHIVVSTKASPHALPEPPPQHTPALLEPTQRHLPKMHYGYQLQKTGRACGCFVRHVEMYCAHLNGH